MEKNKQLFEELKELIELLKQQNHIRLLEQRKLLYKRILEETRDRLGMEFSSGIRMQGERWEELNAKCLELENKIKNVDNQILFTAEGNPY